MFLLHTLVYLFFTYVMYVQANKSVILYQVRGREVHWNRYLWYFVLVFTLIGGLRWNVGADSYAYAQGFKFPDKYMDTYLENKEYLWYALLKLHSIFGLHYVFGMCVAAFLQIFFITNAAKEYRYIFICMPIVLFGSMYFCDMMNGVRQLIAAAIFVYASREIINNRLWRYLLLITIAALFHHSAILLYPFYLIRFIPSKFYDIAQYRIPCLLVFFGCFVLGRVPQFSAYLSLFNDIALFSNYENYSTQVMDVVEGGVEDKFNFGLMQASWFLTSAFTIWFAPQIKDEYNGKIPYFKLWYFFSFLFACLYFLVQNVGIALIRPVMYLEFFHMIVISLLLYHFYSQRRRPRHMFLFWVFFVVIWSSTVWNIMKAVPVYPNEIAIYKLCLFHDIHL